MMEGDEATALPSRRLSVLIVGDGDFSGSLAVLQAYDHHIWRLVATSLLASEEEWLNTYPQSRSIIEELRQHEIVSLMFGVDATQLGHQQQSFSFSWYRLV